MGMGQYTNVADRQERQDRTDNGPIYAIGPLSVLSCLSCLSVTLVYCGKTAGWIKMKLGMEVGLGPGHIVLDGDPALSKKGAQLPQFSAHVRCGQTADWIKMPLGMEVGLAQATLSSTGTQLAPEKSTANPYILYSVLPNGRRYLLITVILQYVNLSMFEILTILSSLVV